MVQKYPTTTSLISSANPSGQGQPVTFTATVTPSGPYAVTGRVIFRDAGMGIGTVSLSVGTASITKTNLSVGTHAITAEYLSDTLNDKSTSPVVIQVVQQATTSATLTSSPYPSSAGQAVTFTATITSPTVLPTGPVTFAVGKTVLGTAQLSGGKAKFTFSTLAVGATKVTATNYGNSNIAKSWVSVTQTVRQYRARAWQAFNRREKQGRLRNHHSAHRGIEGFERNRDFCDSCGVSHCGVLHFGTCLLAWSQPPNSVVREPLSARCD
jgi:hypothetical protein